MPAPERTTIQGASHQAEVAWVDNDWGYMRVVPPVRVGDISLGIVRDDTGIELVEYSSGFSPDSGTLYRMAADVGAEYETRELAERTRQAALQLMEYAGAAASRDGFIAFLQAEEDSKHQ